MAKAAATRGCVDARWAWLVLGLALASVCAASPGEQAARADAPATRAVVDAPRERSLDVRDVGIYSDLDARVQLALPAVLDTRRVRAAVDRARAQLVLYDADQPIKAYPLGGSVELRIGTVTLALRPGDASELRPLLAADRLFVFERAVELPPGDADGDGLPDPLDILIGARKTALNADKYDGRYVRIEYPGGDVPREIGVCTDVIVRSLRNAGYDLQRLVHEDILQARRAYPMVSKPNTDIDHRRVKSLLPYFQRNAEALADPRDPMRAGDVIFMDTFPDRPGSEHVGILADANSGSGQPLVINNWTDGTVTKPMDLLSFVPVTQRYRLPVRLPDRGPIAALRTQLVSVVSDGWNATRGTLRRYEREPGRAFRAVGKPVRVVLGRSGYGWGDGLHGDGAPQGLAGPVKREGDGRSPAGVFTLGQLYGYAGQAPRTRLPYTQAGAALRCVDDASSRHYNQILDEAPGWRSAEHMLRDDDLYELALVVEHNRAPVVAGHGSCIFLHVWQDANTPVTGCTAMDKAELRELTSWLQPNAAVLVALPASEYKSLQRAWGLP
jgi:uncharacterized protein YijF (DUF1287 family)